MDEKKYKSKARSLAEQGHEFLKSGNLEEARRCFEEAIKLDKLEGVAWYGKGFVLTVHGNRDEALACFFDAIHCFSIELRMDLQDSYAWLRKGCCHYILPQTQFKFDIPEFKKAIQCFENAIKIQPNIAEAWYNLGVAQYIMGEFRTAFNYFNKAFDINRDIMKTWALDFSWRRDVLYNNEAAGLLGKIKKYYNIDEYVKSQRKHHSMQHGNRCYGSVKEGRPGILWK